MIALGMTAAEKAEEIARYCHDHAIRRVFVFVPKRFQTPFDPVPGVLVEHIDWPDIIRYVFYYRLIQEIDKDTLLVVDECLRTQNRHELTYNCLRNFLNQTRHQLIFQRLPVIDTWDDFAILFDLDTRSRWKREKIGRERLGESTIRIVRERAPTFHPIEIAASPLVQAEYAVERKRLFAELGPGDPHTLPRNLHLIGGKMRLGRIQEDRLYVGRNNRYKLPNLTTYRDVEHCSAPRTVFEWCHNFVDFSDFLAMTGQTALDVITTDLKVDLWYLERYTAWAKRIADAYATLHG